MTTTADEPLQPRTANLLWALVATLALSAVCSQCACTHSGPPTHVALPTAAEVQTRVGAPILAARASNAKAVQLAARAEKSGLAAGSADAHALTLSTTETARQLDDALAGKDALTAQINTGQKLTDALEKDDAEKTRLVVTEKARGDKEESAHERWRRWAIGGLVLTGVLVSLAGAKLQELLDAAERLALREAEGVVSIFKGWVMKIPAVVKYVGLGLKFAAVAAAFV